MNAIKRLPTDIANKIAAGEVITEPVDVVKELVENALDAKATRITVELQEGGIQSIAVIDDGDGIHADDASLLFERHATSKIESAKDLFQVSSFGFRGEALASIASISKIQVYSRHKDEMQGFRITKYGQNLMGNERISREKGTRIEVEDLFFNTPVRSHFLDKTKTLERHVTELMEAIAVSHPEIEFRYFVDDELVFQTRGDSDELSAIEEIFGEELTKNLLAIDTPIQNGRVKGYISNLALTKGTKRFQYVFVNGRYVKDGHFDMALKNAYEGLLMLRRFPVCFLWIDLKVSDVDVNVHPRKLEVRIRAYEELIKSLGDTLRERLRKKQDFVQVKSEPPKVFEPIRNVEQIDFSTITKREEPTVVREVVEVYEEPSYHDFIDRLSYIGQAFDSFLIYQSGSSMYLMDQHAAHEKVLFERFMKEWKALEVNSQLLLVPFTVELTSAEKSLIDLEKLEQAGFDVEFFGDKKLVIRAIPHLFTEAQARRFLDTYRTHVIEEKVEDIILMSCKAAIKSNHALDPLEVKTLLEELKTLKDPYTCPHGRPIFIEMTRSEIEKRFERI
ncbi:DNA mismatch repair endonuclease MutL [Guggenheimella bovis]